MNEILIGKGEQPVLLHGRYGNRHGLVAGATGTGKTISLMVLAEGFSRMGVPVFMADIKGDVSGVAMPGTSNDRIRERIEQIGIGLQRLSDEEPRKERGEELACACHVVDGDRFGAGVQPAG